MNGPTNFAASGYPEPGGADLIIPNNDYEVICVIFFPLIPGTVKFPPAFQTVSGWKYQGFQYLIPENSLI